MGERNTRRGNHTRRDGKKGKREGSKEAQEVEQEPLLGLYSLTGSPSVMQAKPKHSLMASLSLSVHFIFLTYFYLCIFGHTGSSLLPLSFLYLPRAGATLHCDVRASHCSGFSCRARALGHTGFSSHGSWALKHRLRSCGEKAQLFHHIWKLPLCSIQRDRTCVPYIGKWILIHCMPPGKSSLHILTPAEISPEFIPWPLGFGLTQSHLVITCGLITSDLMPHIVPRLHWPLLGGLLSSPLAPH